MKTFGARLKYFIENYYISKTQFCFDCDISVYNISQYLNDSCKPKIDKIEKMGELGISLSWLINGIGYPLNSDVINNIYSNPNLVFQILELKSVHINLINWVLKYYGSFPQFYACLSESDTDNLQRIVNNRYLFNPKALDCLRSRGCNIFWLFTGQGNDLIESESALHLATMAELNK